MSAIFITGTGTDVGKTYVTASLIRHLRRMGRNVEALKPVVSGFDPAMPATSDPGVLLTALGLSITLEDIARIAPWRYGAALSPDMAARLEGQTIDVDSVIAFCQTAIQQRRDILLIEGVGGIMVPLDDQRTVLDLMMALKLPLILVAGSYLGTISHTLTALDALFRRNLKVLATIVSETPHSAVPLADTVDAIARFTGPVIGLPRQRYRSGGSETQMDEKTGRTVAAFNRIFGGPGST
ncbi:MAG TPA: dethiobiotin synthase [Xanthobacteraceae bacterium]|nr:dethiobiotin synthase [Xanthobacteraceae bacterium]